MRDESSVFDSLTPHEFAELMQDLGFRAELDLSDPKLPTIKSACDRWPFLVFLVGQEEAGGYGLAKIFTMQPNSRVTAAFCNRWNNEYRLACAHCTNDGVPMLKMEIVLHKTTKGHLRRCFGFWDALQNRFLHALPAPAQGGASQAESANIAGEQQVTELGSLPARDISRSDLSSIERLLSEIAHNTGSMVSNNPGSDIRAVVNRLDTAVDILRTIASNTRS